MIQNDTKVQTISIACFVSSHLLLPLLLLFPLLLSLESSPQLGIALEHFRTKELKQFQAWPAQELSRSIKTLVNYYVHWFRFIDFIHWFIHWLIDSLVDSCSLSWCTQQLRLWAGLSLSFMCFSTSLARQATSSDSSSIKRSDSWTTHELGLASKVLQTTSADKSECQNTLIMCWHWVDVVFLNHPTVYTL